MRATIYNASAGSGKTYTLAYKYIRDVIEEPNLYRNILAVTFTNKATEEMKSRILREVHSLASGDESNYLERLCAELTLSETQVRERASRVRRYILHDYSHFTILTIDRFFQRIIRAFIQELGIDINYNIELDPSTILTQSADRIIEDISANEELKRWIEEFVEERIEDGKSWDIRDGILSLGNEIFKESNRETLDSANSKERLREITDRLNRESAASKNELARIATQAQAIMSEMGLTPFDFSGKSRSFANYFTLYAAGEIKEPNATMRKRAESTDGWGKGVDEAAARLQPLLLQMVDLYDSSIKVWNTTTLVRENYRSFALLTDLYNMVKSLCLEQNMMLLSETKLILSEFIAENDAPFIYEKVGNRFDRYMIDEFQDTSVKEWRNFLPLLQNAMSQSEASSVLIVGDIKQSIYRWRGGDWRILHSMARSDMGAESTEVINLKENYRSLRNIVEFNNAIIERVVQLDNESLNTKLSDARQCEAINLEVEHELRDLLSQAYNQHQQIPRKGGASSGYVEISIQEDEPPIIERIKQTLDLGFRPCEILILVRSNSEGVKVANKLLEFKRENREAAYYFDVMTQEALVVGSAPVTQFIVAALKLSLNDSDAIQRAIYNRFLGDRPLAAEIPESEAELLRSIRLLSCEEAFESIVIGFGLAEQSASIAYLQAIHESICGYCSTKSGDIAQFLKWWEEHGAKRSISVEQSDKSIEITTIHKAKGLEKAVVMIPYCGWALDPKSSGSGKQSSGSAVWAEAQDSLSELGAFPVKYKKSMSQSHFSEQYYREYIYSHIDNINMLYVALTRASQSLHIFVKRGKVGVGKAISEALSIKGDRFTIGDLEGRVREVDGSVECSIGERVAPLPSKASDKERSLYIMDSYPTSNADLRLRLPSERYFGGEEESSELSPRHIGVLMHKVFAESCSLEDVTAKLDSMRLNGVVSQDEYHLLSKRVLWAMRDERINEWFTHEWDEVRNESDIIIPKSSNFKRPDRVMLKGSRAVVVDYKFGDKELKIYKKQVAEYMSLMRDMGYSQVEGYLWYIKSGKIETV